MATLEKTSENSELLTTTNSGKTESRKTESRKTESSKDTKMNDNCELDDGLSTCEHLDLNGKVHECFYRKERTKKKRTLWLNVYS